MVDVNERRNIINCSRIDSDTPILLSPYKNAVDQYNQNAMRTLSDSGEMTIKAVIRCEYDRKKNKDSIADSIQLDSLDDPFQQTKKRKRKSTRKK